CDHAAVSRPRSNAPANVGEMNAAIRGLEVHFSSNILRRNAAIFGIGLEVCLTGDVNVVTHRPGRVIAMRRTFGVDSSAIGEDANLTRDLARRRIVIGTRLDSRDNPDIAAVLADERHAAIGSAVHGDSRRRRNGVGAQLTETATAIVPVTFTVVAAALGPNLGFRGGYCA